MLKSGYKKCRDSRVDWYRSPSKRRMEKHPLKPPSAASSPSPLPPLSPPTPPPSLAPTPPLAPPPGNEGGRLLSGGSEGCLNCDRTAAGRESLKKPGMIRMAWLSSIAAAACRTTSTLFAFNTIMSVSLPACTVSAGNSPSAFAGGRPSNESNSQTSRPCPCLCCRPFCCCCCWLCRPCWPCCLCCCLPACQAPPPLASP
mmetsp:Transcript_19076/g.37790  ORF Transcript_19076/g.37790 Transcript_19076/m.37790 type:complete len:200 (-) Transcript_19076:705-1304(-)